MLVTATVVARAVGFAFHRRGADPSQARERERPTSPGVRRKEWKRAPSEAANETDLASLAGLEKAATSKPETLSDLEQILARRAAARTTKFRVQFVCGAPDCDSLIMKELGIEAADVSGAIVTAATLSFPPKTIGLRILDRDGHEVFARQKAGHNLRLFRTERTSAQRPEVA